MSYLKSNKLQQKQIGFTIVELLIVIVVIGILAAITVVAYNGIQQRANNNSRIAAAQQYAKLLSLYAIENNSYPEFTTAACLGGTYTDDVCDALKNGTVPSTATSQPAFDNALRTVGALPEYPLLNVTGSGSGNEVGMFIYRYGLTNESPARYWRLVYWLEGRAQDCGLQRIIRNTDGSGAGTGAWTVGVNSGEKYSSSPGNVSTLCMVSLLNPDEF